MSSDDKKIWKKPEITSFAGVEEAIAYYSEHGSPEHVAAIKRLFAGAEGDREAAKAYVPRSATRR